MLPPSVVAFSPSVGHVIVPVLIFRSAFASLRISFDFAVFFIVWMDSMSSSYTSLACCVGVKVGSMQWAGNRSKDPEVRYALVRGT